jgi:hypothetical protein
VRVFCPGSGFFLAGGKVEKLEVERDDGLDSLADDRSGTFPLASAELEGDLRIGGEEGARVRSTGSEGSLARGLGGFNWNATGGRGSDDGEEGRSVELDSTSPGACQVVGGITPFGAKNDRIDLMAKASWYMAANLGGTTALL